MRRGWLSDEGWQEAFREAVRSGEVIIHERRRCTRPDGSVLVEFDISYRDDA